MVPSRINKKAQKRTRNSVSKAMWNLGEKEQDERINGWKKQ